MPEKLMRWTGSEWVEVTTLTRNEITIANGLQKDFLYGIHQTQIPTATGCTIDVSEKNMDYITTGPLTRI